MKKIWTMALSALLVLSLASCKQDTPDTPDIPVDTTLCAQTSAYLMAETETGFYYTTGNILYYADRADLTQWARSRRTVVLPQPLGPMMPIFSGPMTVSCRF